MDQQPQKRFFLGISDLNRTLNLDSIFVSANRLWERAPVPMGCEWVMDSGAFTEIWSHGRYLHSVADYAYLIRQWMRYNSHTMLAAVAQDYMCERVICAKVLGKDEIDGRTWVRQIREHQRLTIERYDALIAEDVGGAYIMPVLQGFTPRQYVRHLRAYGPRIAQGAWVGVGSVCKRQGNIKAILAVLRAIKAERPDIRLHGFGVKSTALACPEVVELLYSADSMAWSFQARKNKGDQNSLDVARVFEHKVRTAMGLPPGENLAIRLRNGRVFTYAEEANAKVRARREKMMRRRADDARNQSLSSLIAG
jgi:hypothetical protein